MLRAAHAFKWASSGNEPVRIFTRSATDCDGACRSCEDLESKTRRVGAQRVCEGICPTSNFGNTSENFCAVKSCCEDKLTENTNREKCRGVRAQKSLTRLGTTRDDAAREPSGISEIECHLIAAAELTVSSRSAFSSGADMNWRQ